MDTLGLLGHGLATAGFLALAVLLAVGWRGGAVGLWLIFAAVGTAASAAVGAATSAGLPLDQGWVAVAEVSRSAVWLIALSALGSRGLIPPVLSRLAVVVAVVTPGIAVYAFLPDAVVASSIVGVVRIGLAIGVPLLGLLLLEQLHGNSHATAREALRPLSLGLGAMFVVDVFLHAEATLVQRVTAEAWIVEGFVVAACAPSIALAARRNPDWSLDIFVSRQAMFYSTTLVAVGIYLVTMSAGGYLLERFGGRWGEAAQLVFLIGAGVILLALLASDVARGKLRVFLAKHFYRNKYDYRIEWLRFVRSLASSVNPNGAGPAIIEAVAQIIGSAHGTLWVVEDDGKRLVSIASWSASGLVRQPPQPLAIATEFITFVTRRQWIVDLEEHRQAPDAYQNVRLPEAILACPDLRLLVPLMHSGRIVGLLGLGPPAAPFEMTFEDRDLLRTVGYHIGTHIAQIESDRRLTESRQFEAYSRLTAFLMHDLKNLVAQLSLVVANAERHRRNPAFVDDAIDTIRNSTDRIAKLIEQLRGQDVQGATRRVLLKPLVEHVIQRMAARGPAPTFQCALPGLAVRADPDRLAASIEHLIRNAQDATNNSGSIALRLAADGNRVVMQVADSGCGMSAEFMAERLFRPFDSTKGPRGMGIGAYQVRDYVRSLGGEVAVSSVVGEGTVFSFWLPAAEVADH